MKKRWVKGCIGLGICMALLCGCTVEYGGSAAQENNSAQPPAQQQETGQTETASVSDAIGVKDNKTVYELDDDNSVVTMYLTVRRGNASEYTDHTWSEVNDHSAYYYDERGIERYRVDGLLQAGDENGPLEGEFGYGQNVPNVTVKIRGQTSSNAPVKSYKISIKDGKGTWKNQKVLNLNKHIYDGTRFRNKLAYDLIEGLPDMIGLRTQFVHLYVKDETESSGGDFVDYGLFTHVEQPNKSFLESHGLEKNGNLYKINSFEFYRYEDIIKLATDAGYDEKKFGELLEIKGDDNHQGLIDMLEDVNNYSIPIESVFKKWFDEDNFFSWMAFHILTGNIDTQNRNTLLYSPSGADIWYFISWDNDDMMKRAENEIRNYQLDRGWEYGVCNYWGNVLFRRVLKSDELRAKLSDKVEEYHRLLTPEKLAGKIAGYRTVIDEYRYRTPDSLNISIDKAAYESVCEKMPYEIEENYQAFLKSLDSPMPFFINVSSGEDEKLKFQWDVSYDFQQSDITYSVELAQDYSFKNPIVDEKGLFLTELETQMLPPGKYFVRIMAYTDDGRSQYAFDYYVANNEKVFGVKCFYIMEDGRIEEDIYSEAQ